MRLCANLCATRPVTNLFLVVCALLVESNEQVQYQSASVRWLYRTHDCTAVTQVVQRIPQHHRNDRRWCAGTAICDEVPDLVRRRSRNVALLEHVSIHTVAGCCCLRFPILNIDMFVRNTSLYLLSSKCRLVLMSWSIRLGQPCTSRKFEVY